jgi:tetratricopeptide (TPR) repeat protein
MSKRKTEAGKGTPPARHTARWIALGLALATLAVYWPVTGFQFVNYDDTDFVTANPHVQAGLTTASFKWAWQSEVARNWHPITMLTHILDCQLFGLRPGWPHLVNLLLHIANTLLLFHLLKRMTGAMWRAAAVAALFALHPLHVESVAWVAERKDVLSTLFWFLTTWAYLRYAENLKFQKLNFKYYYALALLFYALGLMSKPMLVTLPFTLLLLDYWPLGRLRFGAGSSWGPWVEKIPFLAMSAALCVVTYRIQQQGGAVLDAGNRPLDFRLGNALVSYACYIGKMFWPRHLAGLYLHPSPWAGWQVALAALLLLGLTALALAQGRRRPYLAVGWFWYVGTLVPVIGLVQVGMQAMADRYTYVPLIGLFVILAWGGCELAGAWGWSKFLPAAAVGALAACAAASARQVSFWKDSETLFNRMIDATPNNYMAHYNLANLRTREKRIEEAISNYAAALEEEPNYADAHNNLGGLLLDQKRYEEAIGHYRAALRINPGYLRYFNLANALADAASARRDTNQFAEAVQTYRQALQLEPGSGEAHQNLGLTWQAQGRDEEALAEFEQAARLDSNRLDTWTQLGFCYARRNDMERAAAAFREIIRLRPGDAGAYGCLGNALAEQKKLAEAIPFYLTALKLNPGDYQTEFNLGLTLWRQGKREEAAEHYRQALRINPNYAEAQTALRALQSAAEPPGKAER